jgi:hypothetical protein
MIHHLLSHSDGDDWLKVNQFFMEQLAYLAGKLDGIREGERTLLDNTMLMHCSSMMAGAKHDNDQLPVIVLGGAGGDCRAVACSITPANPSASSAASFMSMMDKMDNTRCDRDGRAGDGVFRFQGSAHSQGALF